MILKKHLKLANVKELFVKDQLSLIKDLIKASVVNFPFQNITTFGIYLPCDRNTPDFGQIVRAGMKGEGGLCGHLNNHMHLQLQILGYQAHLVSGCFRRTGVPGSHFLIKVKIPGNVVKDTGLKPMEPRPDKSYLVDVGCGIPLHEPIPLDNLPYHGTAGGLQYRYEWIEEGKTLQRVNVNGDAIMGEKSPDFLSPQDYTIDLSPRVYTDFRPAVHAVYSNPRSVYLHQGIYCFRYLDIKEDDFEIVCARGTDLMFITKETRHCQSFGSYEKLKPSLLKYFPMVNSQEIDLTVKHFSIPFEEALKIPSSRKN